MASVGVTRFLPGSMQAGFFDGREDTYKPLPDLERDAPDNVAAAILVALTQRPYAGSASSS